jgi:hypothetical protein
LAEAGLVSPDIPRSKWAVTFTEAADRTRVETVVLYASAENLQTAIGMAWKTG